MAVGDKTAIYDIYIYMSSVLEIVHIGIIEIVHIEPSIIWVLQLGQLGRFGLIYKGVLRSIGSQRDGQQQQQRLGQVTILQVIILKDDDFKLLGK